MIAVGAGAGAQSALAVNTKEFDGNPLTIWIGDNGSFQDRVAGNTDNSFFPRDWPNGNAGFVLAFPTGQDPLYSALNGKVWGWTSDGSGPSLDGEFTPISQTNWTVSSTDAAKYEQVTEYQVAAPVSAPVPLLNVAQTATYVNGASSFVVTYVVSTLLPAPVKFRALVGADVFLNNSDCGSGVFKEGPPRFVGGSSLGRVGGFTEASEPWDRYFEGPYGGPSFPFNFFCQTSPTTSPGVWDYLAGAHSGPGFPNTHDDSSIDNGIGIQWDRYFAFALPALTPSVPFQLNTLGTVPADLSLSPPSQTVNAGKQAKLSATALDSAGAGAAEIPIHFTASGANSASGNVTTNSAGQATISYTATRPGTDTVAAYEDLNGNSMQDSDEPRATATVTVQGQAQPPAARDTTAPTLRVVAARALKLKAFKRGLTAIVTSNEASSLKFELLSGRPLSLRVRSFSQTLTRQSLPLSGAGTRAVKLKPSRRLIGKARRFKVQLRVTAVDRAGNKTVVTRTIRVR